jgi:oligoendopeptidase F
MTAPKSPPSWDLDQLYPPDLERLESDLARLKASAEEFQAWRAVIGAPEGPGGPGGAPGGAPGGGEGPAAAPGEAGPGLKAQFGAMLRDLEAIQSIAERVSAYAYLRFAQDTSDQKAVSLLSRVEETLARLDNDLLFFELWWKGLPDGPAAELSSSAPAQRYWLERTRALRAHTLTEREERIVNLKDLTGSVSLVKLYDTITNAYRFSDSFLPSPAGRALTREELSVHVRSHLPEVRAGAYRELFRVFVEDSAVLGQIFQVRARDWSTENVGLRGYESPQAVRHKANDLAPEVVDSLLRVCRSKAPEVFGRFFKKKAERLGLGRLSRYDLYAPLAPQGGETSFEEGLAVVKGAFEAFDPEMAALAMSVAANRRLSADIRPGKTSGAFCSSVLPGDIPWVLMSWTGQRRDLFTLAHELGHAVHSLLARDLDVFSYHSALPLAETASTFAEMLLADRLLAQAPPGEARDDLVFHLLDDAYATIGRQAFFALFEIEAHRLAADGATPDELAAAYLANLNAQFGESVAVSGEFAWEWTTIPHFLHTPFYVYAYSFGQLLVYSLWRLRQKEGPSFAKRLKAILAQGGSASPAAILASAGVGPLDDDFWAGGFEVIEGFLA